LILAADARACFFWEGQEMTDNPNIPMTPNYQTPNPIDPAGALKGPAIGLMVAGISWNFGAGNQRHA